MPELYIISGSNGAGKSSTGQYYLPEHIRNHHLPFDGDKLFGEKRKELYKTQTPSLKEAERLANEWLQEEFEYRVSDAISRSHPFVYEGHFPDDANWETLWRFRSHGYSIHMIFLGLINTAVSELRVLERAKKGGHHVPPFEIERNFYGNLYQLNKKYAELDELQLIDTSEIFPKAISIIQLGTVMESLPVKDIPDWVEDKLPDIFERLYNFHNPF